MLWDSNQDWRIYGNSLIFLPLQYLWMKEGTEGRSSQEYWHHRLNTSYSWKSRELGKLNHISACETVPRSVLLLMETITISHCVFRLFISLLICWFLLLQGLALHFSIFCGLDFVNVWTGNWGTLKCYSGPQDQEPHCACEQVQKVRKSILGPSIIPLFNIKPL